MRWDGPTWRCVRCDFENATVRRRCRNCACEREASVASEKQVEGDVYELVLVNVQQEGSQRARTTEALSGVLEKYKFDLGVLVSLVQQDGRAWIECAIDGEGPPGLGPHVGKLLREVADKIEQDMNAQSAKGEEG